MLSTRITAKELSFDRETSERDPSRIFRNGINFCEDGLENFD